MIRSRFAARAAVCAAAFAALAIGPSPAAASDDAFAPFLDPAASPVELGAALIGSAAKLAKGPHAVASGDATVCSIDDIAAKKLAASTDEMLTACASKLSELGWPAPAQSRPLVVVHVRVPAAPSIVVSGGEGRLLWRQGTDTVPAVPSAARADGLSLARDVLFAADRTRTWAAAAAAAAPHGTASLDDAIARHVVGAVVVPGSAPEWFRESLACWLSETTRAAPSPAPPAPQHGCRAWAAPTPAAVASLAAGGEPSACSRPFLARVAAAVVSGAKDGPARASALLAKPGAPGIEALLGKALASALPAAAAQPSGAEAPRCDEKGAAPCPVCRGRSNVEVECGTCAGGGSVSCPSCGGMSSCPYCDGGEIEQYGRYVKCQACLGFGVKLCKACSGKWKLPCKRCNSSGKLSVPCLACEDGTIACPEGGAPFALPPCRWCSATKKPPACEPCLGVGYLGCKSCLGSGDWFCHLCGSKNGRHMNQVCEGCKGVTDAACPDCQGKGRAHCAGCAGTGKAPPVAANCTACKGTSQVALRPEPPLSAEEAEQSRAMIASAIAFLEGSSTGEGFALRGQRRGRLETAGDLDKPTPYSNAVTLWVLATAGGSSTSPAARSAREAVERFANGVIAGNKRVYAGTQAVSHSIRALLLSGSKPNDPLVQGLVKRLAKGQRNGLWPSDLDDPKDTPDAFQALFAAEALRAVRLAGGKVPGEVWQKLLTASSGALERRDMVKKKGWVSGTDIVSAAALAVIAKEGTLGAKATSFDYRSLPPVKAGLAWMDRRFAVEIEPIFVDGARLVHGSDAGQSSWLFAVQRLSMLLSIQNVGGSDWHASGVRALIPQQYKDGSFEERSRDALNGPVRTTIACLLFLVRATPAVTDSKDE